MTSETLGPAVAQGSVARRPVSARPFASSRITMLPRTWTLTLVAPLVCAPLAWGGTITGTVKIKGAAQPAVVYVEAASGSFAAPAEHARVDQQKMAFVPYLLPV